MNIKYFWYYLRTSYRDGRFTAGFYDAYTGLSKNSKNLDYSRGYKKAVGCVQADAEASATLVLELNARRMSQRELEQHLEESHKRMEAVKRTVAENL